MQWKMKKKINRKYLFSIFWLVTDAVYIQI